MATQKHTPGSPELSVVSADVEAPSSNLPAPFLHLEIRRGRTGYPQRPVCSRNFLIGGGPGCDLRLGGDDIPPAHTLLTISEDGAIAQWLAESPPLLVNGKLTHETTLGDGDQIKIGRFEFIVHRLLMPSSAEDAPAQTPSKTPAQSGMETTALLGLLAEAKAEEPVDDLSELPASELLELLEADQETVRHFEECLRQAEAALLHAAAQRAENLLENSDLLDEPLTSSLSDQSAENVETEAHDPEILTELERVIHQLSGFSAELDVRAKRLATEEATQVEAAELLLDAQKELAAQLERFHQQVADSQEQPEPKLRKAA